VRLEAARIRRNDVPVKHLAILGSTGSIGRQCLAVVEALAERFRVVALAAGKNVETLAEQIERHEPDLVSVSDATRAEELAARLRDKGIPLPAIHHGREGMLAVGTHRQADLVVSADRKSTRLNSSHEWISYAV